MADPVINNGNEDEAQKMANKLTDLIVPMMGSFTLGGAMGFCSGIAVKKVSKAAATAIGAVFIVAQGLVRFFFFVFVFVFVFLCVDLSIGSITDQCDPAGFLCWTRL